MYQYTMGCYYFQLEKVFNIKQLADETITIY